MSKSKARPQSSGLYRPESIRDVAESIGLPNLPDSIASMLASDVEYRLHQVIDEAARFMRHGRRTTITTSDIEQALRVLNIEPLYGHSAHNPPTFRRAGPLYPTTSSGQPSGAAHAPVWFVEDEEIDFDLRGLREEKIQLPKPVNWTAHWLAVEGVQPMIPENPPAIPRDVPPEPDVVMKDATSKSGPGLMPARPSAVPISNHHQQQQQLVKQVLSRELQLYYTRLTTTLLPPSTNESDQAKRTAALASLRHDAGLQALLPYLVRWVGEGVVGSLKEGSTSEDGRILEVLLDVVGALLDNQALFVEPYLHQMLPSILSTLLHSSLPPSHARQLRTTAADILSHLLTQHSTTYPSLSPRIMKTLLLALVSPDKGSGTREGAVRGLAGVGKDAIRKGVVEGGGARVVGGECVPGQTGSNVDAVMDALSTLCPPSPNPVPLPVENAEDEQLLNQLRDIFGDFFAGKIMADGAWARALLAGESVSV